MSVVDVALGLWARRLTVIIVGFVVLGLAILYLNVATYTYTASIKIASVDAVDRQRPGGALSGLAAAAGIGLRDPLSDPQFELYIEGLSSVETAKVLEQDPRIMHTIYGPLWDEKNQRWREPTGFRRDAVAFIKTILGIRTFAWQPPDAGRLANYISSNLQITRSKDTIITTVSFVNEDREFALFFIKKLHDVVNEKLRRRAIMRSTASISYLKQQLDVIQVSEYRQALLQALSEQERVRMTASSGLPFAAEIISGPDASGFPDKPRASITLVLAVLLGGTLGLLVAFIRYAIADAKSRRAMSST